MTGPVLKTMVKCWGEEKKKNVKENSFIMFSFINVLKTGPVIEPEKLPVHGSLVGPPVEPLSNR